MAAFSHLSVLLSIIVGLAITQILMGHRALLLSRATIRWAATPLVWSVLLLVIAAQFWWSSFGLAEHRSWSFAAFSVVVLQTVLLYLMAGLVLPDARPGEAVDLAAHYNRQRIPLFGLLLASLAVSVAKDWVLAGQLPSQPNLIFHGVFAVIAILLLAIRNQRAHLVLAIGTAVVVTLYVALLFATL